MTASSITVRDAAGDPKALMTDLAAGVHTPVHLEDATQRAALLAPLGAPADAAWASGNGSIIAVLKGIFGRLASGLAASENHIGSVSGESAVVSANFSRPNDTTPYVAGDLIANSTVAGSVAPTPLPVARTNQNTGLMRRFRLATNRIGSGTEVVRIHFFTIAPTVVNGDNGAFSANGVASGHIGFVDITLDRLFTDGARGAGIPLVGSDFMFSTPAGTQNVFFLLEARTGFTPLANQTFTVTAEVMRD